MDKTTYELLSEMLKNYTPCAILYNGDHAALFKIRWSLEQPNMFDLIDPRHDNVCGSVDKKDPNARFFCVQMLEKSKAGKMYVTVTLPNGQRKEFAEAQHALVSGAVDEYVFVKQVTAFNAIGHILLDMEDAGLKDSNIAKSLYSLQEYITIEDPGEQYLYEFYDNLSPVRPARHYFVMDSYVMGSRNTHYEALRALKKMAEVFGWKVEVEERYE